MDETELWNALLAAERELRLARGDLSEAGIEDSAFANFEDIQNRVAKATEIYALAKRRWRERSGGGRSGSGR
jgi:hypothetical protein